MPRKFFPPAIPKLRVRRFILRASVTASRRACAPTRRMSGPIRFRGGRSSRYAAPDATPTGRTPSAPRWTPGAAAPALRALRALASKAEQHPLQCLVAAAGDDLQWSRLSRAVRSHASRPQAECALAVLDFHRARACASPPSERSGLLELVLRTWRKNAARCAEPAPLGIPAAAGLQPPSFLAWLDDEPAAPVRSNPPAMRGSLQGPMRRAHEWGLVRIAVDEIGRAHV